MQVPSSCGRCEDAAWGAATVLAALLVLPFIPIVVVAGVVSEIVHRIREW